MIRICNEITASTDKLLLDQFPRSCTVFTEHSKDGAANWNNRTAWMNIPFRWQI